MNITCPHCGFTKELNPARVPDNVKKVVCPRCKVPFALPERVIQDAAKPTEPPLPPKISMVTPTVAPPAAIAAAGLPKAGFWIRVVASLLDSMLAGMVQFVFAFILTMTAGRMDSQDHAGYGMLTTLFCFVFGIVYSVFFTGYCGQTPGKMVVRIKVIRASGAEISYGRAFLREVPGKFLSGLILGIGYLMVAFDDRKQGLHDRIADTYVVRL